MIDGDSTLADVCFEVGAALKRAGMAAVLTGGSAASMYAPQAYMSRDADFILDQDDALDDVAAALASAGFRRDGKSWIFVHPASLFTVDFPRGPLAVGGDYVRQTNILTRSDGSTLRILTRFDCVRDRLAHFYFWDDYTALNAAVGVAADADPFDLVALRDWTQREPKLLVKYDEFERRYIARSSAHQIR